MINPKTFAVTFLVISSGSAAYLGQPCNTLIPDLQCIAGGNMHCALQPDDFSFRCECNLHHNSNLAGRWCHGTFGASCIELSNQALDCNTDRRMRCYLEPVIIGTCLCSSSGALIYNDETDSCVGRAGFTCQINATAPFGLTCTKNAFCDDNAGTQSPLCKCLPGYYQDSEGQCIKNGGLHGAICNSDDICDWDVHHLRCKDNTCQCGHDYLADPSSGTCLRIYGAQCSGVDPCDEKNFIKCSSSSGHPGVCRCENDEQQLYEESSLACRTRARKYYGGAPCVQNASRQSLEENCECDPGFIATHEGRCRAAQFPELGDPCDMGGPSCAVDTYSECTLLDNQTVCQCPPDRNSNLPGHLCYLRYGQLCSDLQGFHCNTDRQLECDLLFNRCRCFNQFNTVYDSERDTCLVLTGGKCTDGDTEFDQRCVDNATCGGACRCDPGFEETEDRHCAPMI